MSDSETRAAVSGFNPATKLENPIDVFSKWQDLSNKQAQFRQSLAEGANLEQQTAASKQKQAQDSNDYMTKKLAGVLVKPDNEKADAAGELIANLRKGGSISQQDATNYQTLIDHAKETGDVSHIDNVVKAAIMSNLTAEQQAKQVGEQGSYNQGGENQYYNKPGSLMPNAGVLQKTTVLTNTPTPEKLNEQGTTYDEDGNAIHGRQWQFGGMVNGAGQPINSNNSPTVKPGTGDYRAPGSVNPAAPMANGPVKVNPQAQTAANTATETYLKDRTAANDANTGLAVQERTILRANDELNQVTTGPGTPTVQSARNFLSTLTGLVSGKTTQADIDAGKYDELKKDLVRIATSSGMSQKSVAGLEAAFHGNANEVMNRLANMNILNQVLGANRQQQLALEITKDQQTGHDYPAAQKTANSYDPRALALDTLTSEQAVRMYKEMPALEKSKFDHTVAVMLTQHPEWLQPRPAVIPPPRVTTPAKPPISTQVPAQPNNMLTNPDTSGLRFNN